MPHSLNLRPSTGTALVLGGGGSAGNAWLIGVIAGLFEAGLDVTTADVIIGTSAGSTAAAQVTGADPTALLADILSFTALPRPAQGRPRHRPGVPTLTMSHLERLDATISASTDAADLRRRMSVALLADPASHGEAQSQWRTTVAARLPTASWPKQRVLITAVDALTAEPVIFDRESGVDIVDAVAASCAGGFAYAIGDGRYIDGGYRSNADNADLAAGCDRVLVLSPLGGRARTPKAWGTHLETQIAELRANGSEVATIFPDESALTAFGDNVMNPMTRPPAARAGYEQGAGLAAELTPFWRGGHPIHSN